MCYNTRMDPDRVPTVVRRVSPLSHIVNERTITLNPYALAQYEAGYGGLIQDCFPYLSAEDREFIKSGITPEEWNNMFPEEDNE